MSTDLALRLENGIYTLYLDEQGDLAHEDSFDTAIVYSLLGERRASPSEVPDSKYRRGWIGNEFNNFENGSKLWLYSQERVTRTVLNGIKDVARDSLLWFVEDGLLKDVLTNASVKKGVVILEVKLIRFDSSVDVRYFELWENTGVK